MIHISNGIDVKAEWTKLIAISPDGVNWSTFPKSDITVSQHAIRLDEKNPNALDKRKGSHWKITLKNNTDSVLIKFDPNEVANQATWLGNTYAKTQIAVDDISTWLSL